MTAADGTPLWANAAFLKLSGAANDATSIRSSGSSPTIPTPPRRSTGWPSPPSRDAARARRSACRAASAARRTARAGIACASAPSAAATARIGWLIADITREREHQENIFQELQNAIDYLDHAPAGFFSLEPDGRIRYLNATLAEWIGIDLAEFEPGAAAHPRHRHGRGPVRHPGGQSRAAREAGDARPRPRAHRRHAAAGAAPPSRAGRARRHGRRLAHARPRHAAGRRPRGRPHRRDALRPLLQQHADGDRLGRPAGPDRAHQRPLRHAVRQRRARAGSRLADLVQESDRAGARRGDRRGDRRPERDSRRRRRASPTRRSAARASSSARSWKATTARTRPSSTRWRRPSSGRSSSSSRRARRCRRSASSPAASRTTSTTC